MNKKKIIIAILIVLLAAASRLVKHPFNFTPIAAMALFAGCYLDKRWGYALPLLAMMVSDYFIGFYDWQVMASVYVAIFIAYLVGWLFSKYKKWYNLIWAALLSSVSFFVITNLAVWAFFNWYPHTWAGLTSCFTLALPFFRNTLIGDLTYSFILFGAFELAWFYQEKRSKVQQAIANK